MSQNTAEQQPPTTTPTPPVTPQPPLPPSTQSMGYCFTCSREALLKRQHPSNELACCRCRSTFVQQLNSQEDVLDVRQFQSSQQYPSYTRGGPEHRDMVRRHLRRGVGPSPVITHFMTTSGMQQQQNPTTTNPNATSVSWGMELHRDPISGGWTVTRLDTPTATLQQQPPSIQRLLNLHPFLSSISGGDGVGAGGGLFQGPNGQLFTSLDPILAQLFAASAPQTERPTDPDVIYVLEQEARQIPVHDEFHCAVCMAPAEEAEVVEGSGCVKVIDLPCGHGFHQSCIIPWLKTHHTCPVCRDVLDH